MPARTFQTARKSKQTKKVKRRRMMSDTESENDSEDEIIQPEIIPEVPNMELPNPLKKGKKEKKKKSKNIRNEKKEYKILQTKKISKNITFERMLKIETYEIFTKFNRDGSERESPTWQKREDKTPLKYYLIRNKRYWFNKHKSDWVHQHVNYDDIKIRDIEKDVKWEKLKLEDVIQLHKIISDWDNEMISTLDKGLDNMDRKRRYGFTMAYRCGWTGQSFN